MAKLVLVPNNMKSRGAKALAATLSDKLGYKVWRVRAERIRKRVPFVLKPGTDKLSQLKCFNQNEIPHPPFTTVRADTLPWLNDGSAVVCRRLLRASEGRGITIAETEQELVAAPLYTRYMPKKEEYRVHVLDGKVIDVQQKRKRKGEHDDRNTRIRNLANGYVFCRDGITEPPTLREIAIKAVAALGSRLGAVDMAYNVKKEMLIVLEVNATPGMQGDTVNKYANAIIAGMPKGRSFRGEQI